MSSTVFALQLPNSRESGDHLLDRLPSAQRERWAQLGPKRASTYLWSRLFIQERVLPSKQLTVGHWAVIERDGLPPAIVSDRDQSIRLGLSLSHSGRWVVVALTRGESAAEAPLVGIDIEKIDAHRSADMATFFCSDEQQQQIAQLDAGQQASAVTRLWCMKEAWFKARQVGILNPDIKRLHFQPATRDNYDLTCQRFDNNYWLALAGHSLVVDDIHCFRCEPQAPDPVFLALPRQACDWAYFKALRA